MAVDECVQHESGYVLVNVRGTTEGQCTDGDIIIGLDDHFLAHTHTHSHA